MSHIVTIKTQVRDKAAVEAACQRLQLPQPEQGTFKLFSGEATGIAVCLPAWKFPVVCNTTNGELRYDTYEGRWGRSSPARSVPAGIRRRTSEDRSPPARAHLYGASFGRWLHQADHQRRGCSLNRTVEVIISPQGETKIETKGFAGAECQQATAALENALGLRQAEQLTAEYHAVTSSLPHQQVRT